MIRIPRSHWLVPALVLAMTACGGGDPVEPPPPVSVTVSPANATVNAGESQSFTATVTNASNTEVTWTATGGTINGAGTTVTYTAPLEGGPFTVTARSVEDATKSATATVTVLAVAVSVSPATVTIGAGGTQEFTATVSNSSAGVTWTATGGTITGTGSTVTYTAPATGGAYTVRATSVTDPSKVGAAAATVTPVAVQVSPATRSAFRGEPVTLSASVSGTTVTGLTWTASCGDLSGTGASVSWTAPQTAGSCTVTARSTLDQTATGVALMTVRPSFRVAILADADDGACSWTHCSLREAIAAANVAANADSIILAVPAPAGAAVANTITLASALPQITGPTHIVGPGTDMLAIDADASASTQRRIFDFAGAFTASVSGLTLTGGVAAGGGAVHLDGGADVTIANVTMTDNEVRSVDGGALRVVGGSTARLTNVILEGNRTIGNNLAGGAISAGGGSNVVMTGGRMKDNVVQHGWGGGLRVLNATAALTNVLIQGNTVQAGGVGGGGVFAEGTGSLTLDGVTVSGNSAPGGEGGGVRSTNGHSVTVLNSTISENTASSGAGLSLAGLQPSTISGSTISDNTAATRAGAAFITGSSDVTFTNVTVSDNVASANAGGGINLQGSAIARLQGGTVSGNVAQGGGQNGGGVVLFSGTTLIATNTVFDGNQVAGGFGAGIHATGATVTLTNVTLRNHGASGGVGGAGLGVFDNSTLTMTGGTIRDNYAKAGAGGGMFVRSSTATVTDVSFIDNDADLQGGAVQETLASTVTLTNVTMTGNHAVQGGGAIGLFDQGNLTITSSIFTGNSTAANGGAISKGGTSTLLVTDSRFNQNGATLQSGGLHLVGTGQATLRRVALTGNSAVTGGGAATNGGPLLIENSTISGNTSGTQALPGSGQGGGLFLASTGTSTIRNSTVSGNTATTLGGGISVTGVATIQGVTIANNTGGTFGGGLASNNNGNVTITNSLLAANTITGLGTVNCGVGGAGVITSLGYNLSDNLSCSVAIVIGANVVAPFFSNPNDKVNVAANLGPLADNGGPTHTHALLAGSAAINSGNQATCTATDQRGYSRQGTCDIGAFEFGGTAPAPRVGGLRIGSHGRVAPAARPSIRRQPAAIRPARMTGAQVTAGQTMR